MDAANTILRRKFIATDISIKKKERSQISNLTLHCKELEKENLNPKLAEERKYQKTKQINTGTKKSNRKD